MIANKILLVDDDESLIEVCEMALRLEGYQVTTAASGQEALKRVAESPFDLVITDLRMPGSVEGEAVVKAVRTGHPGTDVIVITGTPTLQSAIATLKDGAYDYVLKPFAVDHFKAVVRRCLEYRRLREDLSSERAMRQELKAAYEELQKVEQLKEAIMARVSHELKTPLSEIVMALHLLEDLIEKADAESGKARRKYLDTAKLAYQRLERTLSNLLLFSELKKPAVVGAAESVDLEALCRGVIESLRSVWEPRGLQVSLAFDPGVRPAAGAKDLLARAVQHLVHNAVLFNRLGGSVRLHARMSGDNIQLSVSDTGEGIPESEFNQIFDSFYQVANYLTRKVDGLGLGLAIARRIVEAHGGSILVSSKQGEGSTFTISLPAVVRP